jgi:hypothetical protein
MLYGDALNASLQAAFDDSNIGFSKTSMSTFVAISREKVSYPPTEHGSSMERAMMQIKQEALPPLAPFSVNVDFHSLSSSLMFPSHDLCKPT